MTKVSMITANDSRPNNLLHSSDTPTLGVLMPPDSGLERRWRPERAFVVCVMGAFNMRSDIYKPQFDLFNLDRPAQ